MASLIIYHNSPYTSFHFRMDMGRFGVVFDYFAYPQPEIIERNVRSAHYGRNDPTIILSLLAISRNSLYTSFHFRTDMGRFGVVFDYFAYPQPEIIERNVRSAHYGRNDPTIILSLLAISRNSLYTSFHFRMDMGRFCLSS